MKEVALSVGHYPEKPGACAPVIGCEHKEAGWWVNTIAEFLTSRGIPNYLVPVGTLPQKVDRINDHNCALAVEVHFNACGGCGASGCETLYYPGSSKGKKAAEIMQKYLAPAMGNKDRGAKEGWYKMDRPGILDFYGDEDGDEMPDYFLRKTNMTALILEPEFIEKLGGYSTVDKIDACSAIADAIAEIMNDGSI